jgi:hypothetical protein
MIAEKRFGGKRMDRVSSGRRRWKARVLGAAAIALLWCGWAHAETQVILLRGWFGVFSTGLDAIADELRGKGIKAEAISHLAWKTTAARLAKQRDGGESIRIVLVGHSQGGNNAIDMARELSAHKVPVDLLITLAPFKQDPVPANVVRAINYYQPGGWGSPLVADRDFNGQIANVDVSGDLGIFHVNIDKNARVQAEVVATIAALPR